MSLNVRLGMEEIVGSLLPSCTQPNDRKEMWTLHAQKSICLYNYIILFGENIIENPILRIQSFLVPT